MTRKQAKLLTAKVLRVIAGTEHDIEDLGRLGTVSLEGNYKGWTLKVTAFGTRHAKIATGKNFKRLLAQAAHEMQQASDWRNR